MSETIQQPATTIAVEATGAEPYHLIGKAKKEFQAAQIPKQWRIAVPDPIDGSYMFLAKSCGLLSERELDLTENYDAFELRNMLASGTLTSKELTTAICKRAAIAQQALQCCTEMFFEEGIKRAEYLDEHFAKTGKPIGPLHGLPISLKDTFRYAGYDATAGIVSAANKPVEEHELFVQMLLDAGAVLYCKTNIPQSLMTADSENHLYGRALNPLNVKLTAGGSSGGEGSLIAFGGSVLGFGTDIAGSIRIPSWAHGDYSLKPTTGRVPYYGESALRGSGMFGIYPVAGPMATSPRSINMAMEAITASKPWEWDFTCVHNQWPTTPVPKTKLSIGILRGDGLVNLLPPVARALNEAKAKMVAAGIEVIEMDWIEPEEAYIVSMNLLQLDGGRGLNAMLKPTGEPYIQSIVHSCWPFPFLPAKTLDEYFAFNLRRSKIAAKWLKHWNTQEIQHGRQIDALLCPLSPFPVPRLNEYDYDNMTVLWNLIDYPAAVFPVTKFDQDKDNIPIPESISDYDIRVQKLWKDPTAYGNIPINLQLVGRKHEDAKLVQTLEAVDAVINPKL